MRLGPRNPVLLPSLNTPAAVHGLAAIDKGVPAPRSDDALLTHLPGTPIFRRFRRSEGFHGGATRAHVFSHGAYALPVFGGRNVLLIPLYTIYLGPKDFGVLALLTISGTLILRTVETPVGNAIQRFYFRPDYRRPSRRATYSIWCFSRRPMCWLFSYSTGWPAVPSPVSAFGKHPWSPLCALHGFVVALSITTSLTGVFVLLVGAVTGLQRDASVYSVVVTGIVSVWLFSTLVASVCRRRDRPGRRPVVQTLVCLPLLVRHCTAHGSIRTVLREPLRFGYATLLRVFEHPDHRRRPLSC